MVTLPTARQKLSHWLWIVGFLTAFCINENAFAYPEMFRHGYASCRSCHYSPTGGGILAPYGRRSTEEILSSWGQEGEGQSLYGALKPPGWLDVGGDFRSIYLFFNDLPITQPIFILMQAEIELAVKPHPQWSLVITSGRDQHSRKTLADNVFYSRRYYLLFEPSRSVSLRAGRFFPAFGIQYPDHTILTNANLGFVEGSETHNIEASWTEPDYDLFATLLLGRLDNPNLDRDTGLTLRTSLSVHPSARLGVSYLFGERRDFNRHVLGPFAYISLSRALLWLTEIDTTYVTPHSESLPSAFGVTFYTKLDLELTRGVQIFLGQELAQMRWGDPNAVVDATGLGIQLFPRPHFDIQVNYKWRKDLPGPTREHQHFFFVVTHFYV